MTDGPGPVLLTCEEAHVGLARLEGAPGLSHHLLPFLLQRRHLGHRGQKHEATRRRRGSDRSGSGRSVRWQFII